MFFNPIRLKFALKLRGITQTTLAKKLGLSFKAVSNHQAGINKPSSQAIQNIAEILNLPVTFFQGEDIDEIPLEAISFRAISKMTATKRDMCRSEGNLAIMINDWLEQYFYLPQLDLPDLCGDIGVYDPELIAEQLRLYWGLGVQPITNMMHLLEAKGVKVFSLSRQEKDADAFAFWLNNLKPFILLDITRSAERCRFDLAHELGHLIMHKKQILNSDNIDRKQLEKEANSFAASFLMPKSGLMIPKPITHNIMMHYKKIWGVSLVALSNRLHKLGQISDWNYRSIFMQFGRRNEPESITHEQSKILTKVLSLLSEDGKTTEHIANELNIAHSDVVSCLFGMETKTKRPQFTLIK